MRGHIARLIAILLLASAAMPVLAMPAALVYVGSAMLAAGTAYTVAAIALIVVGTVWGQSEQRRAMAEADAAARAAYNAALRNRTATVIAQDHPLVYLYGECVVGARIVDVLTSGNRDQYHHLVCVLADHECESILDVALNDKWLGALDANGHVTGGDFYQTNLVPTTEYTTGTSFNLAHIPSPGTLQVVYKERDTEKLMPYTLVGTTVTVATSKQFTCRYQYSVGTPHARVIKRLGVPGTPADATTLAECPTQFAATDVLEGKTVIIVRVDLDWPEFQSGVPRIMAKVRGKKLHDVRSPSYPNDVPAWSMNPALVIADYLTSEMCNVPWGDLPLDDFIAAANDCDTLINFTNNLGVVYQDKKYTCNGTVQSDQERSQVLQALINSMAGTLTSVVWSIHSGSWQAPVMSLSQSDVIGSFNYSGGSPESELFNVIRGQFNSPENNWVTTDFKPYKNAVYIAADRKELPTSIDFHFTNSTQRVHNICRIMAADQRNAFTIQAEWSLKTWKLKPGQRIQFTSAFLGQNAKIYRVIDKKIDPFKPIQMKIKEDAAAIYDLADAVVADLTPNSNLPNPFIVSALASVTLTSGTDTLMMEADGTVVSRILVQWPQSINFNIVHGGVIQVEWQRFSDTVWKRTEVHGSETQAWCSPVLDGAFYQIRARCVDPYLNITSPWIYANHQVVGKTAAPSNITGFSCAQNGANVIYRWDKCPDVDYSGAEIRYVAKGGAWNDGMSLTKSTKGTQITTAAVPPGDWTHMIKSIDTSGNYSAAEARFDLLVSSTFNLIYSEDEAPDWHGTLTGLVRHWTGVLIPVSKNVASAYGWDTFNKLVPDPVAVCEYEHAEVAFGFDSNLRTWQTLDARIPPAGSGVAAVTPHIDYRTEAGVYGGFKPWTVGEVIASRIKMKLVIDTSVGTPVIYSFKPSLDVPETNYSLNVTVPVGGLAFTWPKRFHLKPSVWANALGTAGRIAMIDPATVTVSGGTVKVLDLGGTDVGGPAVVNSTGA